MNSQARSYDPQVILTNIHDGLVLLDLDGRIQYANQVFAEMAGMPVEQLYGKRLDEIFDRETCSRIDPSQLSVLEHNTQAHFNVELPRNDGTTGSYCFSAVLVRDEQNNAMGTLENFRDMNKLRSMILQLQEVNQAIQREKDKTQRIMDSIADGIFMVDQDRRILSFSSKMEELTGIVSSEAVGRTCMDVLRGTKCDTDCPLVWSFAHAAPVDGCREVLRIPNGRQIPVSITTAFMQDEQEGALRLIGVVSDFSEIERLRGELHGKYSYRNIIGRTPAMRRIYQVIETVAPTDATVLIRGETGTGKDLVAQAIQYGSMRCNGPFVMLNCAALNDNLLESELFGHVRGAFTGAVTEKPGRFEMAAGGTLFLDEIGDTSPALQSKLLRALEEKSFERVGDTRTRKVDVRIIAATNRDLEKMVKDGRFREDLYFRLAVMPISIPPLRERREDIPLLVQHFIDKFRSRYFAGREEQFEGISNRALAMLLDYDWPGNVRELEHAIEHAMISTTTRRIERAFLPDPIRKLQQSDREAKEFSVSEAPETDLRAILERYHWNLSRAAKALNIGRTTLWRRMKKLDLHR
jgi:PAS domain S-box-containing protein